MNTHSGPFVSFSQVRSHCFSGLSLLVGLGLTIVLGGCAGITPPGSNPGNPISNPAAPATPTQILYVVHAQTVGTFIVDPHTGSVTAAGPDVVVAAVPSHEAPISTVAAPDGRFLYVVWPFDPSLPQHLSVFSTDAHGVPQTPPVQTLDLPPAGFGYGFAIDPGGRFAYLVQNTSDADEVASATIRVLSIDPASGRLTDTGLSTNTRNLRLARCFFTPSVVTAARSIRRRLLHSMARPR
jgi:hypothetical protein